MSGAILHQKNLSHWTVQHIQCQEHKNIFPNQKVVEPIPVLPPLLRIRVFKLHTEGHKRLSEGSVSAYNLLRFTEILYVVLLCKHLHMRVTYKFEYISSISFQYNSQKAQKSFSLARSRYQSSIVKFLVILKYFSQTFAYEYFLFLLWTMDIDV